MAGDPDFLIRADRLASQVWFDSVASSVKVESGTDKVALLTLLKRDDFRDLHELRLNGSVTLGGARRLIASGLASVSEMGVHPLGRVGGNLVSVDVTDAGIGRIEAFRKLLSRWDWYHLLIEGLTNYACRDTGEGICLAREHFLYALKFRDEPILARIVMPTSERFEFPDIRANAPRDEDFATERLSREGNWSPNFSGRTSARIFAPFFDWDRLIQTVDRSHFPQKRWSDLL